MRAPRPDFGPPHPLNDALVGVYLTRAAKAFHRRAQKAEALVQRHARQVAALELLISQLRGRITNLRNREKAQRQRANRLHRFVDEVDRLKRERDPLARIIALGKAFP